MLYFEYEVLINRVFFFYISSRKPLTYLHVVTSNENEMTRKIKKEVIEIKKSHESGFNGCVLQYHL